MVDGHGRCVVVGGSCVLYWLIEGQLGVSGYKSSLREAKVSIGVQEEEDIAPQGMKNDGLRRKKSSITLNRQDVVLLHSSNTSDTSPALIYKVDGIVVDPRSKGK